MKSENQNPNEDFISPDNSLNNPSYTETGTDPLLDSVRSFDPILTPHPVDVDTLLKIRRSVKAPRQFLPDHLLRPVTAFAAAVALFASGVVIDFSDKDAGPNSNLNSTDFSTLAAPPATANQYGLSTGSTEGYASSPDPAHTGTDSARMIAPWYSTRSYLTAGPSLDSAVTSASGFILTNSNEKAENAALRIAKRLGVKGQVTTSDWGVQIGNGLTETLSLTSQGEAPGNWSYHNPDLDPWRICNLYIAPDVSTTSSMSGASSPKTLAPPSATSGDSSAGSSTIEPEQCKPKVSPPPSSKDAVSKARDLFADLNAPGLSFDVYRDELTVIVQGRLLLDGEVTDAAYWSATYTADGLLYASGTLLTVRRTAPFELITPLAAVTRANDVRFSTYASFPAEYKAEELAEKQPDLNKISYPIEDVLITSAKLSTITLYETNSVGGPLQLVPAWKLGSSDGRTWLVLAVADRHLDTTPRGYGNGVTAGKADVPQNR
jgi:hypothetical protein